MIIISYFFLILATIISFFLISRAHNISKVMQRLKTNKKKVALVEYRVDFTVAIILLAAMIFIIFSSLFSYILVWELNC